MVRQGKKLMGVQKPFLWMVWAEESSLESEEFLRRCVDRWHSSLSSDFEVHLVEAKHFDLWLNSSALPQNFGDLPSKVQEDILKVALLAHFGGVLVDVDSIPIQQDSMMQIWTSLQHSDAQALGNLFLSPGMPVESRHVVLGRQEGQCLYEALVEAASGGNRWGQSLKRFLNFQVWKGSFFDG